MIRDAPPLSLGLSVIQAPLTCDSQAIRGPSNPASLVHILILHFLCCVTSGLCDQTGAEMVAYRFHDQVMRPDCFCLVHPVHRGASCHGTKGEEWRPLALSHMSEPAWRQIPQPRPSLPLITALATP